MTVPQMNYKDIPRPLKPNPNIKYTTTFHGRNDDGAAYSSLTRFRKSFSTAIYKKQSWILEGQDRETSFINALRKLYRTLEFPEVEMVKLSNMSGQYEVIEDYKHALKQLVGLPDFGPRTYVRDAKSFEVVTRRTVEQPEKKRLNTHQVMYNRIAKLSEVTGPRHLCEVLRDAMLGLLNIYRMGYVHREIAPDTVMISTESPTDKFGYMLSKDGKSVKGKARPFKGFIYDFTVCKSMKEESDQYAGDTESMETSGSTPTPVLGMDKRSDYVHLPTYDLKSFLWLLLYTATQIIGEYASGKQKVRLDDPAYLAAKARKEMKDSGSAARDSGENAEKNDPQQTDTVINRDPEGEKRFQATSGTVVSMDVDTKNALETTVEQDKTGSSSSADDVDVEMNEVNTQHNLDIEPEEDKKRKRDDDADSEEDRKSKGKQKADPQTHEQEEKEEKEGGLDSDEEEDGVLNPPHAGVYYFKVLGPGLMINVLKPFDFKPPENFKPPLNGKPEYVAFEEDRMAHVIHMLLEPSSQTAFITAKPFRCHLIEKFEYFLFGSPALRPFYPLVMELYALNLNFYVPREEVSKGREYTKDEMEEIFESYLQAFEKHMPEEEDWYYLKEYEGTDVQYKFYYDQYRGAFASPTNYKAS
ncbi:hypothetical protein A7U60_g1146 [Sanghuangporus baumii]|uniref:Fungal-type protein kinase domain-containing protein n=1 Tax=Sanghuangporus baumii TaxID=108892 RepID=A0A9Q5NBH4_SANBA|nr:hypothetical protein A7U60_g1146 [Sanghuangporus baumii]